MRGHLRPCATSYASSTTSMLGLWICRAIIVSGLFGARAYDEAAELLNSTGGATPIITIARASAASDGYLAKADFASFDARRFGGGRNLVDWTSDPAQWVNTGTGATAYASASQRWNGTIAALQRKPTTMSSNARMRVTPRVLTPTPLRSWWGNRLRALALACSLISSSSSADGRARLSRSSC